MRPHRSTADKILKGGVGIAKFCRPLRRRNDGSVPIQKFQKVELIAFRHLPRQIEIFGGIRGCAIQTQSPCGSRDSEVAIASHPSRHFVSPAAKLALKLRDQRCRALIFGFLERVARYRPAPATPPPPPTGIPSAQNGQKFAAKGHRLGVCHSPIQASARVQPPSDRSAQFFKFADAA